MSEPDRRAHLPIVLIADDDDLMRSLTASTLDSEGFETIGVANGQEAIAALGRIRPDLLLLDVDMPVMDGFTTCEQVRSMTIGRDLPIVIVTASEDTASIDRAFDAGATDFISKPVNWSLIGHRMRYVLRASRTRAALASSEAQNRALLEAMPDRLVLTSANGDIQAVIENAREARGSRASDDQPLVGRPLEAILPEAESKRARALIRQVLTQGGEAAFEYTCQGTAGEPEHVEARLLRHSPTIVLMILRDITARKRAERQIHRLAFYDTLTQLPNRQWLLSHGGELLRSVDGHRERFALCYLNLDQFKRINDTLGPSVGDSALQELATRLRRCCDGVAARGVRIEMARLGGDEFIVLCAISEPSDVERLVKRLHRELALPVACDRHQLVITGSIGSAIHPTDGEDVATLLKNAGKALSSAKAGGRNTHRAYSRADHEPPEDALALESALRNAIERNELVLQFQPKFDLRTGTLTGAEALVRWRHPVRGMIPPGDFIPLAEGNGLIVDIDRWVIDAACRHLRQWLDAGIDPVAISINLSGREFCFDQPEITLQRALRRHGVEPRLLELEITETALMADPDSARATLKKLETMGFRLALDDFGSGYSSLGYLKRFPLHVLKIDRAFVADLERNSNDRALCRAVISMARALDLEVVAEGIETEGQRRILCDEGCPIGQGYLLSKPLDGGAFEAELRASAASGARAARPSRPRTGPSPPH